MPPGANDTTLAEAIAGANIITLRKVLAQMISTAPACKVQAKRFLLLGADIDRAAPAGTDPSSKKRKFEHARPRYEHCTQCGEDYDVELNESRYGNDSCERHPGKLFSNRDPAGRLSRALR